MEQRDISNFQRKDIENERFWTRFGGAPEFKGKSFLDIGCGQGGLCIDIALAGALQVVGIDIEQRVIDFARENLTLNYPSLADRVIFECMNIAEYCPDSLFDIIVSKDSFEHYRDIYRMLAEMKRLLKPNGFIYIGFGPLFNSINGGHAARVLIPWGHLFMPEWLYIRYMTWDRRHTMKSMDDMKLNRLSFREYHQALVNSGLTIRYFRTNCGTNPLYKLFRLFPQIPVLKEYCTANLYCILHKNP
jgi:SAM-dependent methyltransferase